MSNVTNISQLSTGGQVSALLTAGLDVVENFTQYSSESQTSGSLPTGLMKSGVTLAKMFASTLGSTSVNANSAASIAGNLVGNTSIAGKGFIDAAANNSNLFSQTSELLKGQTELNFTDGLGELVSGDFFVDDAMLSAVSNSAFSASSDVLAGLPFGTSLSGASSAGLTVPNIIDPAAIPTDWIFITAPQDIGWDKQGNISTVDNYGTNSPYVIYSSTGMRKLSMNDVLIEGFSAGKEVEDHIIKLESMMNMVMNGESGYVSPYVWDLKSGDKSYGNFVIESLSIKEVMRNTKGRADRATASITLQQVPDFQINTGRDLATAADLASGKSIVSDKDKAGAAAAGGAAKPGAKATTGNTSSGNGGGDKEATPSKEPPAVDPGTITAN